MIVDVHGLVKTAVQLVLLKMIFVRHGSTAGVCWLPGLGCDAHHCCCHVSQTYWLACNLAFLSPSEPCLCTGSKLLLAYPEQDFSVPLQLEACHAFLQQCMAPSEVSRSTTDFQEAVFDLLNGMCPPHMPTPDVHTFTLVVDSMLGDSWMIGADVPPYEVLVQLHMRVLPLLHRALGAGSDACLVYEQVLTGLAADSKTGRPCDATQTVQAVLLMAQHGVPGLSERCCELLIDALDPYTEEWAQATFGQEFLAAVEAVAYGDKELPPSNSIVPWSSVAFPRLAVSQLDNAAYLTLLDEETPDWMIPAQLQWQHFESLREAADSEHNQDLDAVTVDSGGDAAHELQKEYGHLLTRKHRKS